MPEDPAPSTPPSIGTMAPVIQSAASEARNTMSRATSAGSPTLPSFAATKTGADLVHRAAVGVVLERKVLAPYRRILRVIRQLHNSKERISSLLFAFNDIHKQREADHRSQRGNNYRKE
jgi:hypothetical protein